jgi:hypothetical protein
MPYPHGVEAWRIKSFSNAHTNFTQPLDENQSYDLFIDSPFFSRLPVFEQYRKCTQNLQWIIQDAMSKQMNVRAMGSGWSLSKVAVCDDAIINTMALRHKVKLKEENFDAAFLAAGNRADNYRFLQCGNTIISINQYLEKTSKPAKSLRASGGSNGQTIVGAFSTGTHGAALYFGALSEMVVGLHIVTGPNRHVYIERKKRVVTSKIFHDKLGAEVIIDDDLFNAALVSFGSFGIVHGVLLEIEDLFLLKQNLKRIPFDQNLENTLAQGDFSHIQQHLKYPLNDPAHTLYHFELAINPHDFAFNNKDKGVYLRSMVKTAVEPYDPMTVDEKLTYGDDTLGLIQKVLDMVQQTAGFLNRLLIPKLVNTLFKLAYDRPEEATGTIGETFNSTKFRGNLFSAAFGLDRKDVVAVIRHCLAINQNTKLAGVMAFRFVKGTKATLGFTHWDNSCVLELDGAEAAVNYDFMKKLADTMEANNIPYTLHWGKINRLLDKRRIEKMYGPDRLTAWKQQRSRIMTEEVQKTFNNEFMMQTGLDEFVPYPEPGAAAPIV